MTLLAGDYVIVRSLAEIEATLDDKGCLEDLPFMPEMVPYCGTAHRVFKRIDKIIDIVQYTGLRRMKNTVTLGNVRCDGAAHGGCQSGCQLLWKDAWLKRCTREEAQRALERGAPASAGLLSRLEPVVATAPRTVYRCQATELFKASSYLHRRDPRQYLLPLWFGNVTFVEFLRVISIELFNGVQRLRKGCEYPYWVGSESDKTPTGGLELQAGDWVRVRSKDEILSTLDRGNRNRGLWFDREMVRYCGRRFRVLRRVERLIKEKTGTLHVLKNPSVILEGVTARGEFYKFNPQHDYLLWRDVWLEHADQDAAERPPH